MLKKYIGEKLITFRKDSRRHKRLHFWLWIISTGISLTIAVASNFEFGSGWLSSGTLAGVLGILLPAITAYIVLRSPEQLWILETVTKHRLSDLEQKIDVAVTQGVSEDDPKFQEEYFRILKDAVDGWQHLKSVK
jgi:hypothetical protein